MEALIPFVQAQFGRTNRWCWETIIEKVADHLSITLDADHLIYVGGTLRTGRFAFRRNDAHWRSLCDAVIDDGREAARILSEVRTALTGVEIRDIAARWYARVSERVAQIASAECRSFVRQILQWEGSVWSGNHSLPPRLDASRSIIYALWRLDSRGEPIAELPLYVGETGGRISDRIERPPEKCHRDWWGENKLIGVTICEVCPHQRKAIEKAVIEALVPFCNVKGSKLSQLWSFPRPSVPPPCGE